MVYLFCWMLLFILFAIMIVYLLDVCVHCFLRFELLCEQICGCTDWSDARMWFYTVHCSTTHFWKCHSSMAMTRPSILAYDLPSFNIYCCLMCVVHSAPIHCWMQRWAWIFTHFGRIEYARKQFDFQFDIFVCSFSTVGMPNGATHISTQNVYSAVHHTRYDVVNSHWKINHFVCSCRTIYTCTDLCNMHA